jgi:hypothetical protein
MSGLASIWNDLGYQFSGAQVLNQNMYLGTLRLSLSSEHLSGSHGCELHTSFKLKLHGSHGVFA